MAIHPAILWSLGAIFTGATAAVAVDFAGVRTALQDAMLVENVDPAGADTPAPDGGAVTDAADVDGAGEGETSDPAATAETGGDVAAEEPVTLALAVDPEEPPTLSDGVPAGALTAPDAGPAGRPDLPRFDLLRAEPDGSLVIAGTGPADANIEIVAGTRTVATARAAANGDFVAVLDEPLAPGDYQIVLRATTPDGVAVTSLETAIVAIPEPGSSDVLALVEAPGAPSRLITTPGPETPVLTPVPDADGTDAEGAAQGEAVAALPDDGGSAAEPTADVAATEDDPETAYEQADRQQADVPGEATGETPVAVTPDDPPLDTATAPPAVDDQVAPAEAETAADAPADAPRQETGETTELAALPEAPEAAETEPPAQAEGPADIPAMLRIEAVEIDGNELFVAGAATPGTRLRLYANAMLLGDTIASEGGRFLVQVRRELPVGDYIIRADAIDKATGQVLRRASVPFTRSAGERLAAVAVAPSARLPQTPPTVPFAELTPATPTPGDSDSAASAETPVTPAVPETEADPVAQEATGAPDDDAPVAAAPASRDTEVAAAPSGPAEPVVAPQALGVLQGPPAVAADVPQTTSELVPTGESVIIRRGDTLWQISRRVYGEGVKYTTIYLANEQQISDPDRIWPGQIFDVPDEAMEDAETVHRELRARN
ncbi:MAG: LysM peptidoglycan-binding domain-containing protein [Roseitalea porphyridii]|uniref:LysM peptidoglycan-binding domain-containing protein n=1 Tax=Roseitalea porphyridii TaxID=1852022 RepID=UPI0032D8CC26